MTIKYNSKQQNAASLALTMERHLNNDACLFSLCKSESESRIVSTFSVHNTKKADKRKL